MIVEVVGGADEVPEVRVAQVDDLSKLNLALGAVTDEEADQALREAGMGRMQDADTAFVDVAALRAAAEPQAGDAEWAGKWDGMVRYAREKGWLSEDGESLQVHVESAASG